MKIFQKLEVNTSVFYKRRLANAKREIRFESRRNWLDFQQKKRKNVRMLKQRSREIVYAFEAYY